MVFFIFIFPIGGLDPPHFREVIPPHFRGASRQVSLQMSRQVPLQMSLQMSRQASLSPTRPSARMMHISSNDKQQRQAAASSNDKQQRQAATTSSNDYDSLWTFRVRNVMRSILNRLKTQIKNSRASCAVFNGENDNAVGEVPKKVQNKKLR